MEELEPRASIINITSKEAKIYQYYGIHNKMAERTQPAGVYDQLRKNLPYEETRRYLEKVTGFRKSFVNSSESSNQ